MAQRTYSYQIVRTLNKFFQNKSLISTDSIGDPSINVSFNNYNFNQVFLITSPNHDEKICELPSLIYDNDEINLIHYRNVKEIVTPLSVIQSQTRRTADSIFKYFFNTNVLGISRAVTSKGDVYYGSPGLILNSSFEPIIIGIAEHNRTDYGIRFNRHVLKVSPKVFTSNGMLEKAIISRLIPYYTVNRIDGNTVRVEIDDISKYVVRPIPPKSKVQETMKEMLHTYKDEIMKDLFP